MTTKHGLFDIHSKCGRLDNGRRHAQARLSCCLVILLCDLWTVVSVIRLTLVYGCANARRAL